MRATTAGLDLAIAFFQVHGVDEQSKKVLNRQISHNPMIEFFMHLKPRLIGVRVGGSAHYWAKKRQNEVIQLG